MSFSIGNVHINGRIGLAPMAGVSNPTYIKIVEALGCSFAVTELISSEAIIRGNEKTFEMLDGIEDVRIPVGIQIFGSNPDVMASAAKIIEDKFHPDFIDINMGCPVAKVIKTGAGSALLKDIEKAGKIVESVVKSVSIPVTVKIRSGWDENTINAVEVAQVLEKSGASAITVHARTARQGYSGKADWSVIKKVVDSVSIPVIGNGDVCSGFDAKMMIQETKCSAVMIGRASMGNPWIFKEVDDYLENDILPEYVSLDEKVDMMEYHLECLVNRVGEPRAVIEMRGHILSYLKGIPKNKEIKNLICKANSYKETIDILENLRKEEI